MNNPVPLSQARAPAVSDALSEPTAASVIFEIGIVLATTLGLAGVVGLVLRACGLA